MTQCRTGLLFIISNVDNIILLLTRTYGLLYSSGNQIVSYVHSYVQQCTMYKMLTKLYVLYCQNLNLITKIQVFQYMLIINIEETRLLV
jgi:hypothetical protein